MKPVVTRGRDASGFTSCSEEGRAHGQEHITIDDKVFCASCLFEATVEMYGETKPWFYTGSPHGESLLHLGVEPLRKTRQ